jgi:hypothetical protein
VILIRPRNNEIRRGRSAIPNPLKAGGVGFISSLLSEIFLSSSSLSLLVKIRVLKIGTPAVETGRIDVLAHLTALAVGNRQAICAGII